ncbi:hypothetical protein, conserved [Eimeria brunetti]|uniref:Uncharacterized protein n=1 Tax=Eimeria brunetti TaxID=51314 RepID=U6LLJ8_9EIME|nr:hypothetical protein, conserved [Eimeria brunetti]
MAGPTKARRRKTPGVPAKPVARKPKSVAAAKPTKTAAAAAPSAAAAKTKLKDDKQKRLQEEISARQREILSLKHLVTALAGGAVPLPVPIELFYRIGQQFVGANAKAFTLTFPPLEQLKPQAGSSVEKTEEQVISGGGWEGEREERTETEREEVDDAGREKREEGGEEEGEETMEATLNHSLESQTDAEANGTPAEAGEVDNEQEEIQQAQEQEQQPQQQQLQQSQQPEQPQQVPPQQQPQQVQQVQQQQQQQPQQLQPLQQAQQQQQQQVQIREQELLHEVSLRAQLAEALSDQNEVLQAQTRLLSEAVAKREKRMKDVEEELRILEGKLCSIAQQAEKLVAAAAATRRGAGKQMNMARPHLTKKLSTPARARRLTSASAKSSNRKMKT